MKVLILSNSFRGLYSFRKEVVLAMLDRGYEVCISAPFDDCKDYFSDINCSLIDTQFNRRGTNPVKDLRLMLRYKRMIVQFKPDVVLSYTIKPNIYGGIACQLCSTPQIANITGLGSAVENSGWLQRFTVLLYRIGLRKTKTVFFQNKSNQLFLESFNVIKGKSILIPGSGVNLKYHHYQEYPKATPIRFIFISRLLKEKGIEEYLNAAEIIKQSYPDTEFHILGAGENAYEDRLRHLQETGVVVYHGRKPDVRPFIGKCHCTVHPSFYPEGMSNVLLESCAAGRPIITTERPGCGEIVEDGKTGFLVKAKDTDSLVKTIERFISLPYDQKVLMGQDARKKVEREFNREIVVDSYLKELDAIDHV